ncbi:MAG TPA: hypothetical protein VIK14_12375 [Ignavibacteria bacterium]
MKNKYSIEEIARYNAISVFGSLQELAGLHYPSDKLLVYYKAMLEDLKTGAMERSIKEFDKLVLSIKN